MNIVWNLPGEPISYVNNLGPFRDCRTGNPRERTRQTGINEVLHENQPWERKSSPIINHLTRHNTPRKQPKIVGRWLRDSIVVICWICHLCLSLLIARSTWYLYSATMQFVGMASLVTRTVRSLRWFAARSPTIIAVQGAFGACFNYHRGQWSAWGMTTYIQSAYKVVLRCRLQSESLILRATIGYM